MASKKIQGITIELDGETSGLQSALGKVNSTSKKLEGELKSVNGLLKFDPSNTVAVTQKQELLEKQIKNTSDKLDALRQAQARVDEMFANGDIGESEYRDFQRQVEYTEAALKGYKTQLSNVVTEQENLKTATKQLDTLFEATESSVEDYQDVLGTKLTNAIKNGTASSDDLTVAINKVGKAALGNETDIGKMNDALNKIDDGSSINEVKQELSQLGTEAGTTEQDLSDMSDGIKQGNLMEAGEIIADVGDKILDMGDAAAEASRQYDANEAKLKALFGLTESEAENLSAVAKEVFANGMVDSIDSATEAVSTVKSSFGDLNDTDLVKLTNQLVNISEVTGTDVSENTRAARQLMTNFGISGEQAMDLIASGYQNNLNSSDDFVDTINEYSGLFENAGFSSSEMFAILNSGLKNGAKNSDIIADAIGQFQIKLGDGSFEAAMGSFSTETQDMFRQWQDGKATVSDVMASVGNDLKGMSTSDQQKALSNLSSQFEDMGIDVSLSLFDIGTEFDNVSGKAETMASDAESSSSKWQGSMAELQTAMQPVGEKIQSAMQPVIDIITQIADKFANLPNSVTSVILVVGGLLAAFAVILPVVAAIGAAITAIGLPVIGIIAAVVAVVAAITLLWTKSEGFRNFFINLWEKAKELVAGFVEKFNFGDKIEKIKASFEKLLPKLSKLGDLFKVIGVIIGAILVPVFAGLSGLFGVIIGAIEPLIDIIGAVVDVLSGLGSMLVGVFTGDMEKAGEGAKTFISGIGGIFQGLYDLVIGILGGFLEGIASFFGSLFDAIGVTAVFEQIKTTISTTWTNITAEIQNVWNSIVTFFTEIGTTIANVFSTAWNGIVGFFTGIWTTISTGVSAAWNAITEFLRPVMDTIYNIISVPISVLATIIETMWLLIKAATTIVWTAISNVLSTVWGTISGAASTVFNAIKSVITTIWNNISSITSTVWNAITGVIKGYWNGVATVAKTVFGAISSTISSIWTTLSSTLGGIIDGIKDKFSKGFNAIKDVLTPIIDTIKGVIDGLGSAITAMKDTVSGAVSKIVETIGNIKLPHFSLKKSSVSILGKEIEIPSGFNIDWYADGGIMTRPTVFGANGNSLQVGGEAGREAILPLTEETLAGIGKGIAATMNGNGNAEIIALLKQLVAKNTDMYMDGDKVGSITDTVQGKRAKWSERGVLI
ncbi:MAG: phage tail tape measure protein [Lachnospiraceae bacterium]